MCFLGHKKGKKLGYSSWKSNGHCPNVKGCNIVFTCINIYVSFTGLHFVGQCKTNKFPSHDGHGKVPLLRFAETSVFHATTPFIVSEIIPPVKLDLFITDSDDWKFLKKGPLFPVFALMCAFNTHSPSSHSASVTACTRPGTAVMSLNRALQFPSRLQAQKQAKKCSRTLRLSRARKSRK